MNYINSYMTDWDKIEDEAEDVIPRSRGKYELADTDRERLDTLLEERGGSVALPVRRVQDIFYRGSTNPKTNALLASLNRNFGNQYKFGTRGSGAKIAITLREPSEGEELDESSEREEVDKSPVCSCHGEEWADYRARKIHEAAHRRRQRESEA